MITIANDRVAMKHGAGGRAMRRLIEQVFLRDAGPVAAAMDDGAVIPIAGGASIVITTDSHVIQPAVFPGGDIGRLAVAGTVNDLAMMGATEPLGLTCGVVLEEGYSIEELTRLQASMAEACRGRSVGCLAESRRGRQASSASVDARSLRKFRASRVDPLVSLRHD